MSAESPNLKLATDETEVASPDPFNAATLRLDQSFEEAIGVKKLLATVPVRKPHKQEWIRVHPSEDYRGRFAIIYLKDASGFYIRTPENSARSVHRNRPGHDLHGDQSSARCVLWPARLPAADVVSTRGTHRRTKRPSWR